MTPRSFPAIVGHAASDAAQKFSASALDGLWGAFLKEGSTHSPDGILLPYLLDRCARQGVAYRLSSTVEDGQCVGFHLVPIDGRTGQPLVD